MDALIILPVAYCSDHKQRKIAHTFHDTIISYLGIFLFCALLGLILAIFLSRILTRPVSNLCHEIDILDPSDGTQIDLKSCGSNQELRKLIDSFNGMSQRLFLSLKQNYEIQITEQQMRVQMLQFQINHHFLHNTLNCTAFVISQTLIL